MKHLTYLSDPTDWRLHIVDFNEELDQIISMHRYLISASMRDFTAEYEHQLEIHDPENYDGGDGIWDAEKIVGINPWDVESHAGLMAIARAVSLTEVTLARMAAHGMKPEDAAYWVFPKGGLWLRDWESKFYKFVLVDRFNVGSNGFASLRLLRDLYTHGYGVPATKPKRDRLAQLLYDQFDTSPITPDEEALGYSGSAYFFGHGATYSTKTRELQVEFFARMKADISALATFRALEQLRRHVEAAPAAFGDGYVEDVDASNNKFAKTVVKWWEEKAEGEAKSATSAD